VFNCRVERPEPFEGFAYDEYLASQQIFAVCYQPLYMDVLEFEQWSVVGGILKIKNHFLHTIGSLLPEPHASFLSGLLFGGSLSLSTELKESFSETGTSHILAASGFNVSIFSLTFLSWILSTRIGRKRGLVLTSVLLAVYVILAGASAAVVRAGIMGGVVVLERLISRKAYLLNLFLLTASVMLFFNPLLLFHDVGFQLSFVATIAIVAFTKPLSERLAFLPDSYGLRDAFAGSLAAITLTLPIILWHFGTMSLVAPFANLFVLPLVAYAMAATGIALCIGLFFSSFATIVALPAWALSQVMLMIISLFGSISFASVEIEHHKLFAFVVAMTLFLFWFSYRHSKHQ